MVAIPEATRTREQITLGSQVVKANDSAKHRKIGRVVGITVHASLEGPGWSRYFVRFPLMAKPVECNLHELEPLRLVTGDVILPMAARVRVVPDDGLPFVGHVMGDSRRYAPNGIDVVEITYIVRRDEDGARFDKLEPEQVTWLEVGNAR